MFTILCWKHHCWYNQLNFFTDVSNAEFGVGALEVEQGESFLEVLTSDEG